MLRQICIPTLGDEPTPHALLFHGRGQRFIEGGIIRHVQQLMRELMKYYGCKLDVVPCHHGAEDGIIEMTQRRIRRDPADGDVESLAAQLSGEAPRAPFDEVTAIGDAADDGIAPLPGIDGKFMRGDNEAPASPLEALSDRELEVFRMLGQGKPVRIIADEMNVTIPTINSFRNRIKEKLQLKSSTEVMLQAFQWVQEEKAG